MMERHSLLIGEQDRLWDRRLLVVFVIFLVFALALILPGLFL